MNQFSMGELRDMAAGYVLGALSADEQGAFAAALMNSAELQKDVAEFQSVVDRLGSDGQLAPPAALRARFLERIAAPAATTGD
ncbi:MAG: hypothetical protein M3Y64_01765, partial [Gemmatimonadota bacterium]|nr:hypothetical protein [Gemmatimonadota bacterium]